MTSEQLNLKPGDHVVYPTHGLGKVEKVETQEIGGACLEMVVVNFEQDKMILHVPIAKLSSSGMRKLSSKDIMKSALTTLKGRARKQRSMWSRRAQEYEAKINSGDPVSIAEVVRDLHVRVGEPEQSYSERQLYEAALDRLSRELAAVEGVKQDQAEGKIEKSLRAA